MAVPRNRHSTSRKNKKRAHLAKNPKNFATCKNCKSSILPHRICYGCGHYDGRAYKSGQEEA